jgi:hypothetical protein
MKVVGETDIMELVCSDDAMSIMLRAEPRACGYSREVPFCPPKEQVWAAIGILLRSFTSPSRTFSLAEESQ